MTTTPAIGVPVDRGAERGVVDDPAAVQRAEEVLDLVDGDGVARADVHAAPLLERARPLMPIRRPRASNSGPPELPGLIEASVWMQSVYSSSVPAGGLVTMHAGDDSVSDRGLQVGGQQERIAHRENPIADAERSRCRPVRRTGNRRGRRA